MNLSTSSKGVSEVPRDGLDGAHSRIQQHDIETARPEQVNRRQYGPRRSDASGQRHVIVRRTTKGFVEQDGGRVRYDMRGDEVGIHQTVRCSAKEVTVFFGERKSEGYEI